MASKSAPPRRNDAPPMVPNDHDVFKFTKELVKGLTGLNDAFVTGLFVTLIIGFITLIIFWILNKKKGSRNAILLAGLCDSGKTAIFTQLVHGKKCESYTSIKENSGFYRSPETNKSVRMIDMPGHERLRSRYVEEFKGILKGIVFVIDSSSFQSQLHDVAEYLYNLLADRNISSYCRSVLIACNKQDNSLAKSSKLIRNQLELEINTLRITRSGQLSSVDNSQTDQIVLGKKGKDFEFSQLLPQQIEFVECSAPFEKESQLNSIKNWINKLS